MRPSIVTAIIHPSNWLNNGHWHYLNQTPGKTGQWKQVLFKVNDDSVREADFLVVHEDVDSPVTIRIPAGNSIFVPGEEKSAKQYNADFLEQFDIIATTRDDIKHPRVIRTHYFHPWSVRKTYDELVNAKWVKSHELSAVISNSTWLEGHKKRFAFTNKLKGHFKDRLDWFSKGENTFVADKWDGLAPYKYSVAIENSVHPHYFTEKITDCFLAGVVPFYFGCPDIQNYFDDRSYCLIDGNNFIDTINTIESVILNKEDGFRAEYVREARRLVLEKYHFIAAVTELISGLKSGETRINKTIRPSREFTKASLLGRVRRAAGILLHGA